MGQKKERERNGSPEFLNLTSQESLFNKLGKPWKFSAGFMKKSWAVCLLELITWFKSSAHTWLPIHFILSGYRMRRSTLTPVSVKHLTSSVAARHLSQFMHRFISFGPAVIIVLKCEDFIWEYDENREYYANKEDGTYVQMLRRVVQGMRPMEWALMILLHRPEMKVSSAQMFR